jgi:hypothetical protein
MGELDLVEHSPSVLERRGLGDYIYLDVSSDGGRTWHGRLGQRHRRDSQCSSLVTYAVGEEVVRGCLEWGWGPNYTCTPWRT